MKKKANIVYVRNFISLIFISAFLINKKKNSEKYILILNKQNFNKKNFDYFKIFFFNYFQEIIFIDYKKTILVWSSKNKLKKISLLIRNLLFNKFYYFYKRSNDIKKLSLLIKGIIIKYDIEKVYGGGDNIELAVQLITKKKIQSYWIEHGVGNFTDSINLRNNIFIKSLLNFLFKFRISNYEITNYIGYITVLGHKIKNNILNKHFNYLNLNLKKNTLMKNKINVKIKDINTIINNLISYTNLSKPRTNKDFVYFDFSAHPVPTNSNKVKKTLRSIYGVIDKKKEIILLKHKTHVKNIGYNFQSALLKDLKKNKVKIINFNKYPFQMLPAEVIIKLYKVKKTISYESSAIIFSHILYKNMRNYIFYSYLMNVKNMPKLWWQCVSILRKSFRKIKFI